MDKCGAMARPLRLEFEGASYHITSRGNLRDRIFSDDNDRKRFLEIFRRTKERPGYLLHAIYLDGKSLSPFLRNTKCKISLRSCRKSTQVIRFMQTRGIKDLVVSLREDLRE